jgi:hypothetical protein
VALGIAVLRRNELVEHVGLDRLGDAGPNGLLDPGDIDGEQDVCRTVRALGLDALLGAGARRDDVDLDAARLGESVEQRLMSLPSR